MSGDELELRLAWQRHAGRSPAADRWLDAVLVRHREPHRRYHGVRHLCWVVRHVRSLLATVVTADPGAVVVAAFFHDAVYDPTGTGNESASARIAARALTELGWAPDRIGRVTGLIEATAGHEPGDPAGGATLDRAVLLAADLGVLAAEPARYQDYVNGVRHEYGHLDDATWRTGRTAVLRSFLDRPHIFDPALALDHWEVRARANLTAELATLAG